MRPRPLWEWVILAIAGITVFTGIVQILAAGPILGLLGAERSPASVHFFAIVGMFMVIVGGLVFQELMGTGRDPAVFLWGSLQKFGAAAAVALGVRNQVFSALALLVAGFDFASGLVMFPYWLRLRRPA